MTSTDRRTILKATAGVIGGVSLSGCMQMFASSSSSESGGEGQGGQANEIPTAINPEAYADQFGTVVNIVEDYGADPSGEEPINSALARAWDNDTLIFFPSGEYKMGETFRRTDWENVGLIGHNAVIRHGQVDAIRGHVVTEGEYSGGTMLFRLGTSKTPLKDLVFGGFIFDWSDENAGMQGLNAFVEGKLEVRNIRFHGRHSLGTHGNMRLATATPESYGIADSIDMRWGGLHYVDTINTRVTRRYGGYTDELDFGQSWSTTGITGHKDMAGTIHYNNIFCGGWPGSSMYTRGGGRQIITNCHCANSGGTQIRVNESDDWEPVVPYLDENEDGELTRDGPYGQTTIEDCLTQVERKVDGVYKPQRGIWIQEGNAAIRNVQTTIGVEDGRGPGGGYGIGVRQGADSVELDNVSVDLLAEADAFHFTIPGRTEMRNVQVQTHDWTPRTPTSIFSGGVPPGEDVTVNGESIA